jgi:hypothetical protein
MDHKNRKDKNDIDGSRRAERHHEIFNPSSDAEFADITETPDVAVWAKENRAGVKVSSDMVAEGRITSPARAISENTRAESSAASARKERLVDVANTREVEEAAEQGETLTDKADLSSP